MIYAAKPQRGGRSIQANTNNPPQDPPPAPELVPEITIEPTEVFIPIESTAPPVPEIIEEPIVVPTVIPEIVKVSWFRRLLTKIRNVFRRKQ